MFCNKNPVMKIVFFLLVHMIVYSTPKSYYRHKINLKLLKNRIPSIRPESKHSLRIIDGIEDKSNEYPYVVAIGIKSNVLDLPEEIAHLSEFIRICSGSLISEQFVLTAAHCFITADMRIRYGNMTAPPNDTLASYSEVLRVIAHPGHYDAEFMIKNDIGLLLVNKVRLHLYGRISAVDYRTLVGLPVKYVGLGFTEGSFLEDQARNRQYGEAAVATCPSEMNTLFHPVVCLIRKCSNLQQDSSFSDSGGPLLQDGRIVGVCTGGVDGDFGLREISFYTAVSPFLDWIQTQTTTQVTPGN